MKLLVLLMLSNIYCSLFAMENKTFNQKDLSKRLKYAFLNHNMLAEGSKEIPKVTDIFKHIVNKAFVVPSDTIDVSEYDEIITQDDIYTLCDNYYCSTFAIKIAMSLLYNIRNIDKVNKDDVMISLVNNAEEAFGGGTILLTNYLKKFKLITNYDVDKNAQIEVFNAVCATKHYSITLEQKYLK